MSVITELINRNQPVSVSSSADLLERTYVYEYPVVGFWGLPPLIPLLQCVNRLGFEICSVNSCQSEQGSWLWYSKLAKMLCTGHREFGTHRWRFLSKVNTLYFSVVTIMSLWCVF